MANAARDENRVPTLIAASDVDGTPVILLADPVTGRLKVTSTGGGGSGTQYADGDARGTATGTLVMGDDGTNIQSITAKSLSTVPVNTDVGLITQAIIHGKTTSGGGTYVDVKVNPSGALTTDTTISGTVPLPTGASTSALQTTGNTSLSTIATNTTRPTIITERVSNTDGASTAFTNLGALASNFNYVYALSIFRTDAGTTPIYLDFRDGTAGSVLYSVVLPPNGGAVMANSWDSPLFRTSVNTALAYDLSAATTTVFISVSGFRSTT